MDKNDSDSAIRTLALRAAAKFRQDYVDLSRELFASSTATNGLLHSGEFGRYRETLLATLLSSHLPGRISVGNGFVVSSDGDASTQCDAVLFDRDATPAIDVTGGRCMFPIETCAAVGEVKSVLSLPKLHEALSKLAKTKRMRANMTPYSGPVAPYEAVHTWVNSCASPAAEAFYKPSKFEHQNLVSFLVCERIEWPGNHAPSNYSELNELLGELEEDLKLEPHLRANFILSLADGFLSYFCPYGDRYVPWIYPTFEGEKVPRRWLPARQDNAHIVNFITELARACSSTWIFEFWPYAHFQMTGDFSYQLFDDA